MAKDRKSVRLLLPPNAATESTLVELLAAATALSSGANIEEWGGVGVTPAYNFTNRYQDGASDMFGPFVGANMLAFFQGVEGGWANGPLSLLSWTAEDTYDHSFPELAVGNNQRAWGGTAVAAADVSGRPEVSVFSALLATAANQATEITALGTVNTNLGNIDNSVQDVSSWIAALALVQGVATTGELGPMVQGSVTTSDPAYVTSAVYPLSLTTGGRLRVNATGKSSNNGAAPVASEQLGVLPAAATAAVPAYTEGRQVLLSTDLSGNARVIIATNDTLKLAQASTTSGQIGVLMQGAVTTAAPSYTTAQTNPLSLNTAGGLRSDITHIGGNAVNSKTADGSVMANTIVGGVSASPIYAWDIANNARSLAVYGALQSRVFTATDQALEVRNNTMALGGVAINLGLGATSTGTQRVDANLSLAGVAVVAGSGAITTGTPRVTIATDDSLKIAQAAAVGATVGVTGMWKAVTGDQAYSNATLNIPTMNTAGHPRVDIARLGNQSVDLGNSTVGAGTLRVTIGSDSTGRVNLAVANTALVALVATTNSTGAAHLPVSLSAVFDDASPTAITENNFGAIRMSSRREVYDQIRDAAGNERGANVSAGGGLAANLQEVGASTISTTDASTTGKLPTLYFDGGGNKVLQTYGLIGTAFSAGGNGQRMISVPHAYRTATGTYTNISCDAHSAGFDSTAIGMEVRSDIRGVGGNSLALLVATSNTNGNGYIPASLAAVFDDTSPTAITENNYGSLRMSTRRELYDQIRDAAGNERGLNIDANNRAGVVIANSSRSDVYTATANGTAIDCSTFPFTQYALQVVQSGTVTAWDIRVEGSIDGTNFDQTNYLAQHTNVTGSGAIVWAVDKAVKYVRTRCAGLTLGLGTNVTAYLVAVQ